MICRKMENPEFEHLPPPPTEIPPDVIPEQVQLEKKPDLNNNSSKPKRALMRRPGTGSRGRRMTFITNHFKVGFGNTSGYFYHYCVSSCCALVLLHKCFSLFCIT